MGNVCIENKIGELGSLLSNAFTCNDDHTDYMYTRFPYELVQEKKSRRSVPRRDEHTHHQSHKNG